MTAAPGDDAPPSELWVGPYRLLTRIGEGGMGVVHLGRKETGERAAIKVLRPHVVSDDEARARLAREVNSLGRVRSPRVAEIVDADPWGPIPYVATRYVPGLPLHRHVGEEGVMTGDDLRHFASGLARAVQAVHDVGVLHRDIKPSNVLMEGRNPVLIDFGLARLDDDMKVTRTGYLLGTPGYIAPEILFGQDPTPASDVHSWAATVAFAGLGRPPFGTGHALTVMDRVRRGEHDLDGLDAELHHLVRAALDPDPARRPGLDSVLAALGAAPTPERSVPMTLPFAAVPTEAPAGESGPTHGVPLEPPTVVEEPQPTPPAESRPPDQWPAPPLQPPQRAPYQQPPVAPQSEQRPAPAAYPWEPHRVGWAERARRWVIGGASVGVTAAAAALAPWVFCILVVTGVCLVRAGSLTGSSIAVRRRARGPRWYDPVLMAITAPWHLVVSLLASGALLAWAALLACCVLVVALALGVGDPTALAVSGVVVAASLWTGPGSSRVRSPLRRLALPMARTPLMWALWAAVLVLLSSGMLAAALGQVQWLPADHSPWADGTWLGGWL